MKLIFLFHFILAGSLFSLQQDDFFKNLSDPCLTNTDPYIISNERNQDIILYELSNLPCPSNGVHIGWSIEFNYKIIALRKPQIAIICDRSKKVFDFFQDFQKAFLESEYLIFSESYPDFSWITEDDFNYLKGMYQDQKIHHISLDLMDNEDRFDKLAEWIECNKYVIDTIYVSNALDWIRRTTNLYSQYFNNLNKLMNDKTAFIHCSYHRSMKLRLILGKLK